MLDMKITGADTAQRYSYDGIMLIYYRRLPFSVKPNFPCWIYVNAFTLIIYISTLVSNKIGHVN